MALNIVFNPNPRPTEYVVTTASDLTQGSNGAITSAGTTLTGTFQASDGDAGKLIVVVGAGTTITAADGAMSTVTGRDKNILTSAGASFTSALIGQRITVTGVGAAGVTLTSRVWGVISATQLRLTSNCSTTATSQTYVISADLHATITASTLTTATLDTAAGRTIASGGTYWYGTDDAPTVQAAITAAEAVTGSGNGYTILISGAMAWGSTVRMTKPGVLLGTGADGYSATLAHGTTRVRPMTANMTCFAYGSSSVKLGVNGTMTAASGVLTDPRGQFVVGDVGKTIHVLGAAAQTGSSTLINLTTTIASYTSATQVTLTASAVTSVADATYIYLTSSTGGLAAPTLRQLHFEGFAASLCGVHMVNLSGYTLDHVTISDFYSGVGLFIDGITSFSASPHINDCNFVDCRRGVVAYKGAAIFNGSTMIDGNSNNVGVTPGPGTIGLLALTEAVAPDILAIQACDAGIWHDGVAGRIHLNALRIECCPTGVVMNGDASNGAIGSVINCTSWSNASIGPASCKGVVMGTNVRNTVITPGQSGIDATDMFGSCDATSLSLTLIQDPNIETPQTPAYVTPYTPNISLGKTIKMTLTGPITVNAPITAPGGVDITFDFTQDGTGGRVVTWDAVYKLNWTPTTTASKLNSISFRYNGTNWVQIGGVGI